MSEDLQARIDQLEQRIDELEKTSVDAHLEEWKAKIDNLQLQASLAKMDGKDEVKSSIDRLNDTWNGVRDRLEKIAGDGRRATDSIANGLRSAGSEIKDSFDQARDSLLGGR